MATLVSFHAHPDDESIACGGVMRKAYEEGHRVVLVVATRGELGEVTDGFLDNGEELWERRVRETEAAAAVLGVSRVEFLGYRDSGMMGQPSNEHPDAFWNAPVERAVEQVAEILREENADALTVYDSRGSYGHPDHIQVHRVGIRAAELAGTPKVFQHTMNSDHMRRGLRIFARYAHTVSFTLPDPDQVGEHGMPECEITAAVDVSEFLEHKRKAMRAHASQISEDSFFLGLPDDAFRFAFGTEWFIRNGQGPGITETDLLAGL